MAAPTLLVHIDDSPECTQRLSVAFPIARKLGAHVAAAYFDNSPEIAPAVAALMPAEAVERA